MTKAVHIKNNSIFLLVYNKHKSRNEIAFIWEKTPTTDK